MRGALRRWAPRIGLALLSVGLTLLALEWVLGRHTPRQGAAFFAPPPSGVDVPWVLEPGADVAFEGHYVKIPPTRVRISEQGVREDRVYAVPKPAGTRRILLLGDSFVFGSGVRVEDTFGERFETARPDLEVVNLGVPGYTSGHAVELLARRGLRFEPDGVVLFVSDNDFYRQGADRRRERQEQGEKWATERFLEGRLRGRAKAESAWRKDPEATLQALDAAIGRLRALGRDHGFEVRIFLLFPHPLEAQIRERHPDATRLADADYLKDMESLQIPEDLHPNAEGHRRLAALLGEALTGWP